MIETIIQMIVSVQFRKDIKSGSRTVMWNVRRKLNNRRAILYHQETWRPLAFLEGLFSLKPSLDQRAKGSIDRCGRHLRREEGARW